MATLGSLILFFLNKKNVHDPQMQHNTSKVFSRPGVAGAVLQSPSQFIHSFINSVSEPFLRNLLFIITPKP